MVRSGGSFCTSELAVDSEKPSDTNHQWLRTKVMSSITFPGFCVKSSRERSGHYLQALLVQFGERRNTENLSETFPASARVMQRFLTEARWDDEAVIGRLQEYLGAPSGVSGGGVGSGRQRLPQAGKDRGSRTLFGSSRSWRPLLVCLRLGWAWSGQPFQRLPGSLASGVAGHHVSVFPPALLLDCRGGRSSRHHHGFRLLSGDGL